MLRVLHVVLGLQVGGLEKFVLGLTTAYSDKVTSSIVCLEDNGEAGVHAGANVIALHKRKGYDLSCIRKLAALIQELQIDIVHTHNPAPHFYGAIAGFLAGRPVLHTKHGRNHPGLLSRVLLNKVSSALSYAVVAVSRDAAEVCLNLERINSRKVKVILNGVDPTTFCPPFSPRAAAPLVRLGIVARLSSEKDHATLLRACSLLAAGSSLFHLNIIGDGPLRKAIEQEVVTLGLGRFVTFCGSLNDVPAALHKLDVFVLSSTTEGIPLTLLEAMSAELPVVATAVGGNPEVVVDGVTGFLVQPRDPSRMAEKLALLIQDPALRRDMGRQGRARILAEFSMQTTASKYLDLYASAVDKRGRSANV